MGLRFIIIYLSSFRKQLDILDTWVSEHLFLSAAPWEGRYRHMGLAYPLSKTTDTGILAIFGGYQSGSSKWFDDFWISADDGKNWCMNGDKMPFGQRSAGTIIQIPRHLPDWAPSKLRELPAGDMNTDYH